LSDYAGTYEHPGYGTVQVEVRGRGLHICLGELDLTSHYRHFDTWTVGYAPLEESWPLTFLTDADGGVSALEIPLEASITPIRFEALSREVNG
jgi:hypothetical protein